MWYIRESFCVAPFGDCPCEVRMPVNISLNLHLPGT